MSKLLPRLPEARSLIQQMPSESKNQNPSTASVSAQLAACLATSACNLVTPYLHAQVIRFVLQTCIQLLAASVRMLQRQSI